MRTVLFSLAAAASALALSSPASAQYYPQPQPQPYGYAHGYHNPYNHGQMRSLMTRIDRLQRDVHRFDRAGRLSNGDAARIHHRAEQLRQRLMHASYNGLNRRERVQFDRSLDQLRANMRHEMRQYRGNDRRWGRRTDGRYDNAHQRWHNRNDRRR